MSVTLIILTIYGSNITLIIISYVTMHTYIWLIYMYVDDECGDKTC